jgi:hypothetical protein
MNMCDSNIRDYKKNDTINKNKSNINYTIKEIQLNKLPNI